MSIIQENFPLFGFPCGFYLAKGQDTMKSNTLIEDTDYFTNLIGIE